MGDPDFNKIFNVNSSVEIKLTDKGKEIYLQEWNQVCLDQLEARTHKDGYVSMQLHTVMNTFGKYISMGRPLPFETKIKLKSTSLEQDKS